MPMKQYIEISTNQSVHGQKVTMIKQLKTQLLVS
jgi:translation initiation factor 1 (eIF-1/SUI1)